MTNPTVYNAVSFAIGGGEFSMIGTAGSVPHRSRLGRALLAGLTVISLVAVAAPTASATEGPYEPNDTMQGAVGPLAIQQSYVGALETENDKDFFYFYVSAPSSQVTLTLRNLGGTAVVAHLGVAILHTSGTPVASVPNIEEGESKTIAVTLEPQKYFVEVFSSIDYGSDFSLETGGGGGAFGPFATISANCTAARSATATARRRLTRAEGRLQRATARLRRSLFGAPGVHRSAQAGYRKAKARVTAGRKALKAARGSERPWCFVPQ